MTWFALSEKDMVVRTDGAPLQESDVASWEVTDRFRDDTFATSGNGGCAVVGLPSGAVLPAGYAWQPIRTGFATQPEETVLLLARAKALLAWRQRTRFCGCCGTALQDHASFTARVCPQCGNLIFPRIEPCIIVVVTREDGKILLARHVQRNQDIYACIAGFMEAGETAEQAVAREIREETGLEVKNIRYFGSQSWPFPAQLMLGFTAEYASGTLRLQEDEIAEAQWFDPDNCPASPRPGSIAYRLIHR